MSTKSVSSPLSVASGKEMSPEQLRELDAWISEHVFGWTRIYKMHDGKGNFTQYGYPPDPAGRKEAKDSQCDPSIPTPTSDPADSDALDDAILGKIPRYTITAMGGDFEMMYGGYAVHHADKKICRVLFAKILYGG